MGPVKVAAPSNRPDPLFLLDSGAILEGANVVASQCATTPEVAQEVQAGGATGRRFQQLEAAGLRVEAASPASLALVEREARAAGNLARLSPADRSILALALEHRAQGRLLSDDYTVLDVAHRLGLAASPVTKAGVTKTMAWGARCTGCGREYEAARAGGDCAVCGREIRLKPRRR